MPEKNVDLTFFLNQISRKEHEFYQVFDKLSGICKVKLVIILII